MHRIARLSLVLFLVVWSSAVAVASAQQAATRIAVVNIELVVAGSVPGQELQVRLARFRDDVETQLKTRVDALNAVRARAEGATQSQLASIQKELEEGQIDLKRFQDDKTREGQKMRDEGLREIEQDLGPVLTAIRDEDGYDLVLAQTPGIVLLVADRIDITQKVIDRYNASQ